MRVKDLSDETGIEPEVGVADDALAHPYTAVEPGRRHRRDATRELGFADVAQVRRPLRPHHRAGLHMDGCNEVVAGRHVGDGLVEQVPSLAVFLQVVVRIDDGQAGVDHFLGERALPCPCLGDRPIIVAPKHRRRCGIVCTLEEIHGSGGHSEDVTADEVGRVR